MVDGPSMNIRPPVTAPRPTDAVSPTQAPDSSKEPSVGGLSAPSHAGSASPTASALDPREAFLDMPLSILNSATLTRAEWGWRSFLASFLASVTQKEPPVVRQTEAGRTPTSPTFTGTQATGIAEHQSNDTNTRVLPGATQENGTVQNQTPESQLSGAVSTMRQLIHEMATGPSHRLSEQVVQQHVDTPTIIPFAHVTSDGQAKDSSIVQSWALLDRMESAVQDAQAPIYGGGIVLLPANQEHLSRAVRWRAHRSSQTTSVGQVVHRLVLEVPLQNRPVRVTVITSQPEMAIHVQTNDGRLRGQLEQGQGALKAVLSGEGWNLSHFTTGVLDDVGGDTT